MVLEWLRKKFKKTSNRMIKHEENSSIRDVIKQTKTRLTDPSLIANRVAWRQRTRLKRGLTDIDEAVAEIFLFCRRNSSNRFKQRLVAALLLELICIVAEYRYERRDAVRAILTLLQRVSSQENGPLVHREVYFFEYAHAVVPLGERQTLRNKMFYMMNMVAGWELPKNVLRGTRKGFDQYIDLSLTPYLPFADNILLSEAIYRLQDEEIMLHAIRCGAFVPGILLWPIGMVLDLHRALEVPLDLNSKESLFIRYFCRSRRWIWLGLMPVQNPRPHGIHLPENIPRDDILLLPESASCLVPEDRYKEAASMKHQCRLAIRKVLLKANKLPDGPKDLPLPKVIIRYLDLYED